MNARIIQLAQRKTQSHFSINPSSLYRSKAKSLSSVQRSTLSDIEQKFESFIRADGEKISLTDKLIRGFKESKFECAAGTIHYFLRDEANIVLLDFALAHSEGGGSKKEHYESFERGFPTPTPAPAIAARQLRMCINFRISSWLAMRVHCYRYVRIPHAPNTTGEQIVPFTRAVTGVKKDGSPSGGSHAAHSLLSRLVAAPAACRHISRIAATRLSSINSILAGVIGESNRAAQNFKQKFRRRISSTPAGYGAVKRTTPAWSFLNDTSDLESILIHGRQELPLDQQPRTEARVRWISNRLALTFGLPLLVIAAVALGLLLSRFEATEKITIWWFVVAIVVLTASFIQGQLFDAESRRLKIKGDVKLTCEQNIDPYVSVLTNLAEVRSAAANLIVEAVHNMKAPQIYYFGSASLTPSEQEFRDASHSENYDISDIVLYQNALNDLKASNIKVTRFVRLLENDRFESRDIKARTEYLMWLEYQVGHLKANPNYLLYDCQRAPEWGGPRSSILTNNGMLDIVGDGSAGILLISSRISAVVINESKKYFWAARLCQNRPQPYSTKQANELQGRINALKKIHERCLVENR